MLTKVSAACVSPLGRIHWLSFNRSGNRKSQPVCCCGWKGSFSSSHDAAVAWAGHVSSVQNPGYVIIDEAIDNGTYVPPPVDDEYRDRRLTEFSPLG